MSSSVVFETSVVAGNNDDARRWIVHVALWRGPGIDDEKGLFLRFFFFVRFGKDTLLLITPADASLFFGSHVLFPLPGEVGRGEHGEAEGGGGEAEALWRSSG